MDPPSVKSSLKISLVTPSASPPPPYRMSDSAPLVKRQRTFSTPRRTLPDISSASIPPVDVAKEREAARMRLFDAWSTIEERYTQRIDKDDIVNLRTGEITKDNGFFRNFPKTDFGTIGEPSAGEPTAEYLSDTPEDEEDEYDLDELDAFADENSTTFPSEEGRPDVQTFRSAMPPVVPLDPPNAEELREFLEAERQHKQLCGSDLEEDYDDDAYSSEDPQSEGSNVASQTGLDDFPEAEDTLDEEGSVQGDSGEILDQTVPVDLTSEDELDNWDINEASVIHPVIKSEQLEDTDSDIEIIEPPTPAHAVAHTKPAELQSHLPMKKLYPSSRGTMRSFHQLHTPPQSQSSATPTGEKFIDLSADSPPPSPNRAGNSQSRVAKNILPKLIPVVLLTPRKGYNSHMTRSTPVPLPHAHEEISSLENDHPSSSKALRGTLAGKESEVITKKIEQILPTKARGYVSGHLRNGTPRNPSPELISDTDDPITPASSPSKGSRSVVVKGVKNIVLTAAPLKPRKPNIKKKSEVRMSPDDSHPRPHRSKLPSPELSSPRKRKRVVSDGSSGSTDGATAGMKVERLANSASTSNHATTSRQAADDKPRVRQPKKKLSSEKRGTSSASESEHGEYLNSSGSETGNVYHGNRSQSRVHALPPHPSHYPYPNAPHTHPHHPPQIYPPIQDPRAQLIITSAMQQLSALVGAPWIPPQYYVDGSIPHTPHRHHSVRPPNGSFITPTHHPHPYPFAYDPNLSHATLPPDSPDYDSSPGKTSSGRRKSLVRRSQSRGKRVSFSFQVEQDTQEETDMRSSPPSMRLQPAREREKGGNYMSSKVIAKKREKIQDEEAVSDIHASRRGTTRAQTPGLGSVAVGSSGSGNKHRGRTGYDKSHEMR